MHASSNDHSVHAPAEALLSKTDEQEKQEGDHSSGERDAASVLKLRGCGL